MKTFSTIACGLIAASIAVTPASAAAVFDFTTSSGSSTTGAVGNVRTFSADGINLQVSAYSYNGSSVESAYLGRYDKGLGVTNSISYSSRTGYTTNDDSHTIDNSGNIDFVLLVFDRAVTITGGVLNAFKIGSTTDNDAWVGWGSVTGAYDTTAPYTGPSTSTAGTLFSGSGKNVSGNSSSGAFTSFDTSGKSANVWLISAARDGSIDGFKLGSITVTPSAAVPEPATWAMMISGFGIIGASMRRRRRIAVSFSAA